MSNQENVIPEMVKFETLTKIIIGYLKAQADKEPKSYLDVSKIAKVAGNNVRRNTNFLVSIGILEGEKGQHKLTTFGKKYAQALDWGKFDEANSVLRELLVNTPLVRNISGFIDIHQPTEEDDVLKQIAVISGVPNEARFRTGVKAVFDMLVTSGIIKQDSENKLYTHVRKGDASEISLELKDFLRPKGSGFSMFSPEKGSRQEQRKEEGELSTVKQRFIMPITLNFTIDNKTDETQLKKLLEVIKAVFQEG